MNTEEQAAEDARLAEAAKKTFSDEEFAAEFEKRKGAKLDDYIKKSEQLTPDQVKEIEAKEREEDMRLALEKGWITPTELEDHLKNKNSDKVELARKRFVKDNAGVKNAAAIFDEMLKLNEPDEIDDENENPVPNEKKIAAKKIADMIAEGDDKTGNKIKELPLKRKAFLEEQAVNKRNEDLITKVITEIPKRYKSDIEGTEYGVDYSAEDIEEAKQVALIGLAGKRDLTEKQAQDVANSYLKAKNIDRLLEEGIQVAVAIALAKKERGEKGIIERKSAQNVNTAQVEFNKKYGIPTG